MIYLVHGQSQVWENQPRAAIDPQLDIVRPPGRVTAVRAGQPGLWQNQTWALNAQGWSQLWATGGDPTRPEECSIQREIIERRLYITKINSSSLLNRPMMIGRHYHHSCLQMKVLFIYKILPSGKKNEEESVLLFLQQDGCSSHQEVPSEGVWPCLKEPAEQVPVLQTNTV